MGVLQTPAFLLGYGTNAVSLTQNILLFFQSHPFLHGKRKGDALELDDFHEIQVDRPAQIHPDFFQDPLSGFLGLRIDADLDGGHGFMVAMRYDIVNTLYYQLLTTHLSRRSLIDVAGSLLCRLQRCIFDDQLDLRGDGVVNGDRRGTRVTVPCRTRNDTDLREAGFGLIGLRLSGEGVHRDLLAVDRDLLGIHFGIPRHRLHRLHRGIAVFLRGHLLGERFAGHGDSRKLTRDGSIRLERNEHFRRHTARVELSAINDVPPRGNTGADRAIEVHVRARDGGRGRTAATGGKEERKGGEGEEAVHRG